jgi:anti-sigma factor RsiW
MTKPLHLTEQDRADLVAYLDGELTGEPARALEAKLSLNPNARAEAEALKRTWDLLDFLPRPEPSPSFTHRTVSQLTLSRVSQARWACWRRRALGAAWAASLLLSAWAGYAGYNALVPRQPGEKELLHDLRIIENKRLYDLADDLDFLRALDGADLFGEDRPAS